MSRAHPTRAWIEHPGELAALHRRRFANGEHTFGCERRRRPLAILRERMAVPAL